ncbi:hypothetical protein PCE1_000378 [Barthelona sp. PCE]
METGTYSCLRGFRSQNLDFSLVMGNHTNLLHQFPIPFISDADETGAFAQVIFDVIFDDAVVADKRSYYAAVVSDALHGRFNCLTFLDKDISPMQKLCVVLLQEKRIANEALIEAGFECLSLLRTGDGAVAAALGQWFSFDMDDARFSIVPYDALIIRLCEVLTTLSDDVVARFLANCNIHVFDSLQNNHNFTDAFKGYVEIFGRALPLFFSARSETWHCDTGFFFVNFAVMFIQATQSVIRSLEKDFLDIFTNNLFILMRNFHMLTRDEAIPLPLLILNFFQGNKVVLEPYYTQYINCFLYTLERLLKDNMLAYTSVGTMEEHFRFIEKFGTNNHMMQLVDVQSRVQPLEADYELEEELRKKGIDIDQFKDDFEPSIDNLTLDDLDIVY